MTSPHGPYELGDTRATMVITAGSDDESRSESLKMAQVRIVFCNSRT